MSKREFLNELREQLAYELPEPLVRSNLNYYSDYIDNEVGKGRGLSEVLSDLGDPRLIARSIIDAAKSGSDGIPNTADDRDYSSQIYGGENRGGYYGTGSSSYEAESEDGYRSDAKDRDTSYGGGSQRHHEPHIYMGYHNCGCLGILVVLLVISAVISLVSSALTFLLPILGPLLLVLIIIWFLNNIRGDQ
ncbi:MAG TPA: DUF1700 domain-containing protein [Candidatus Avilachnospira avistercoris]|nr:DUF1700 domain-containing protein [Candidatus Avilachnospira avistercoris]